MKRCKYTGVLLAVVAMFGVSVQADITTNTVTTSNSTATYGDLDGVAIDFDSTVRAAANWTPDLVAGDEYTIKSVGFRVNTNHGKFGSTVDIYLGVYTGLSGNTLSGFEGVSDSAVTLTDASGVVSATWNFTGMTVTPEANPGSGGDQRYFVFQTGTAALTEISGTRDIPLMRNGQGYATRLSGVLRESGLVATGNRSLDYTATLTIPEPASLGLIALIGMGLVALRRFHI